MSTYKISRNSICPCGRDKKYKHCCLGVKDWQSIYAQGNSAVIRNLSLRGKNLYLYDVIVRALGLSMNSNQSMKTIKDACTTNAVRQIHESILDLWPDSEDLFRIYNEIMPDVSGLYSGYYFPSHIIRGVTRHTFYTDKILLMEPFHDPRLTREEYSPLTHPESHIENTLIGIRFMFMLWPWVEAGLVSFIRSPSSFDVRIELEAMKSAESRIKNHPKLEEVLQNSGFLEEQTQEMMEYQFLANPDSRLREIMLEKDPSASTEDINKFIDYINWKRENHAFYTPFVSDEEGQTRQPLLMMTSGANYDMARMLTSLTNSHLITDLALRWEELKIDRAEGNIKNPRWNSFSKAFQELPFTFLNNVRLEAALELRKEEHLENLRSFLSRLWRNNKSEDDLSDENIRILEEELKASIQEADIEWRNINRSLRNWLGVDAIGGIISGFSAPLIEGNADIVLGTIGIASIMQLISSREKKKSHRIRYPAGFFLRLK